MDGNYRIDGIKKKENDFEDGQDKTEIIFWHFQCRYQKQYIPFEYWEWYDGYVCIILVILSELKILFYNGCGSGINCESPYVLIK